MLRCLNLQYKAAPQAAMTRSGCHSPLATSSCRCSCQHFQCFRWPRRQIVSFKSLSGSTYSLKENQPSSSYHLFICPQQNQYLLTTTLVWKITHCHTYTEEIPWKHALFLFLEISGSPRIGIQRLARSGTPSARQALLRTEAKERTLLRPSWPQTACVLQGLLSQDQSLGRPFTLLPPPGVLLLSIPLPQAPAPACTPTGSSDLLTLPRGRRVDNFGQVRRPQKSTTF